MGDGDAIRVGREQAPVWWLPAGVGGYQRTHLALFRAQKNRREGRCAGRQGRAPRDHRKTGLNGRKQSATNETKCQERAKVTPRLRTDLAFPLGDQMAVVPLRDGIGKPDGKAVPDRLVIGYAQSRAFPHLGSLASIVFALKKRSDA
ncbi:hypothetical protein D9M68_774300 [compost metagenome]